MSVCGSWSFQRCPLLFQLSFMFIYFINFSFYSLVCTVYVDGIHYGWQRTKTQFLHSAHNNKLLEPYRFWLIDALPASLHACWTLRRHETRLHVLLAGINDTEMWPQKETKAQCSPGSLRSLFPWCKMCALLSVFGTEMAFIIPFWMEWTLA